MFSFLIKLVTCSSAAHALLYRQMKITCGSNYQLPQEKYDELLHHVVQAGLFGRTKKAHFTIFLITLFGMIFSFIVIASTDTLWVQLLNACFAAFFTVQLGLLGHDLSHKGVFRSSPTNHFLALLVWSLGCGLSEGRWFSKHNAHHQSPNHIGYDPDIDIPFVFSHTQATLRSPFLQKYIFPYQHILFWIGIWFVYPYNIFNSMHFLFREITWRSLFETVLIIIHFAITIGLTFWLLPPLVAILFNVTVFLMIGVYMAMIFAPNHKGEDMLAPEQVHNWVHQITLTRNIFSTPFISYVFGGLEYQIEHHLFPSMSRFHYRDAQAIVKKFCQENSIPYHETTWVQSLHQIHHSLKHEANYWQSLS